MNNHEFTVKQLIERLKLFNPSAQVLLSSDEELNTLYKGLDVCNLQTNVDETGEKTVVLFGFSGLEFDND